MNAAIFASVLLASRLPSTLHVFAIIALATQLFALSPLLRQSIKVHTNWPIYDSALETMVQSDSDVLTATYLWKTTLAIYMGVYDNDFPSIGNDFEHVGCVVCKWYCFHRICLSSFHYLKSEI